MQLGILGRKCSAHDFPTRISYCIDASGIMSLVIKKLAEISLREHPGSSTVAVVAPSEDERIPILKRGVRLVMLRKLLSDLKELERDGINSGQFLNGTHTEDSATDWQEFSRERDEYSGKACCLHTGLSIVETIVSVQLCYIYK